MSRAALQRLLTLLTLALALVLPLRAQAAIVPVCEDDAVSAMPPPPSEPEPSCTVVTSVDEATGETSAAPICDPRGASAVAPQRVLPISDARIDAAPGCGESEAAPAAGPSPRDHLPGIEAASVVVHAVLSEAPVLLPCGDDELLPATPVEGGPRAGALRRVDHPPR